MLFAPNEAQRGYRLHPRAAAVASRAGGFLRDWFARPPLVGRSGAAEACAALALALALSATGAFDTDRTPTALRTLYWMFAMLGGATIAAFTEAALLRRFAALPPMPFAALQFLAMTPPIVAWVWALSSLMLVQDFVIERLPRVTVAVVIINVVALAVACLLRRTQTPAAMEAPAAPHAALIGKLPFHLRNAALFALSAEDHHVRVHTERGAALIYMRFADALRAVETMPGQQTHRSWWVADLGVEAIVTKNGKRSVVLKSGVRAPISRAFATRLKGRAD